MKKLPIGIQTFEQLIQDNYLYIDKTDFVYKMIHEGKAYFLSRPRRFGKSLFLSTLKAFFQGKKDLFTNLAIAKQEYSWQKFPVVHMDFSACEYKSEDDVESYLKAVLYEISDSYNVEINNALKPLQQFRDLLVKLSRINKVVVLIDEYDSPILATLNDVTLCSKIRNSLKIFYTTLKSCDQYIKFIFLTGVSKFAKISVFSGLNNLNDITMHPNYAALCGYTQKEMESSFQEYLKILLEKENRGIDDLKKLIKKWYNGFQFSNVPIQVYNPISILKLFDTMQFEPYWFETATPSFLIDLIKKYDYDVKELDNLVLRSTSLDSYEIDNLSLEPLLFQTGYITIKHYDKNQRQYTLGYPNFEVKESFLHHLFKIFSSVTSRTAPTILNKLENALISGNIEKTLTLLQIFFANIQYDLHLKNEKYYQTIFYLIFTLLGLKIHVEQKTNKGRIDAVIETNTSVYLFEFKLFDTAENALKQIKEMEYYQQYLNCKKDTILIGVEFSSKERNIHKWIVEKV